MEGGGRVEGRKEGMGVDGGRVVGYGSVTRSGDWGVVKMCVGNRER